MNEHELWYDSYFPEEFFPIHKDNIVQHKDTTIIGKTRAKKQSVLIVGCCRDVEKALPQNIARIETLGSHFETYRVLFYENDSEDKTKEMLFSWAEQNHRVNIISENLNLPKNKQDTSLERATAMANARNKYLDVIQEKKLFERYDYIIVYDLDILGGFSYRGIFNTLGQSNWDFVGSNGIVFENKVKLFYDWWAYLALNERENRPAEEINLLDFKNGADMILVNSCFGGLGIYKSHCFSNDIRYTNTQCDHATLNLQLRDKRYRMYLNPSQIVLYNKWN